MPTWGADLSGINFDEIFYYLRPTEEQGKSWDDVPEEIKNTWLDRYHSTFLYEGAIF